MQGERASAYQTEDPNGSEGDENGMWDTQPAAGQCMMTFKRIWTTIACVARSETSLLLLVAARGRSGGCVTIGQMQLIRALASVFDCLQGYSIRRPNKDNGLPAHN